MEYRSGLAYRVRRAILTSVLGLRAMLAGLVLSLLDLWALLKAGGRWLVARLLGIRHTPEVEQWRGIPSVLTVPHSEDLDFNFWRKPTYLVPTLKAMVRHKVSKLLDERRVQVIPDTELADWILKGPLSRLVVAHNDWYEVDMSAVERLATDEGVNLHGPTVRLCKSSLMPLDIRFTNGETVTPEEGAHWSLAKLHFQSAATYLLPGRFHGNIHFGLPCVAAASLHHLPKDSVLFQLLKPHLRFTLRINNEALRVQRAQDRSKPYAPFPVTGDEFVRGIAEDVNEHLLEPGFSAPPWSLANQELPFNRAGQMYYEQVRSFVNQLLPYVADQDLHDWRQFMAHYIPGFLDTDPAEALATLIWQVSFLHSMDHYTMEHGMDVQRYLFVKPRLPAPVESGIQKSLSDDQVVRLMCGVEDRYRVNVFARTFVAGHKHPLWSNTMDNIRYKFREPALQALAEEFRQQLQTTDQRLASDGLQLTPLNQVFQSICW